MMMRFFSSPRAPSASPGKTNEESTDKDAVSLSAGTSNNPESDRAVTNHIKKMDTIIRRKLHGSGAQYNMKVVIRGERGVGKTTLWRRLQGLDYEEKYIPTPEIQTTTINNWVYKGSEDVVKVEVWDVVDRGLAHGGVGRIPEGGKLEDAVAGLPPDKDTARGGRSLAVLDASVVNVYQGANAVIFMLDPYRPETLGKVEEGLKEAPVNLSAVVLLNFRDRREDDKSAKNVTARERRRRGFAQEDTPPVTPAKLSEAAPGGTAAASAGTPKDKDVNSSNKDEASAPTSPRGVSKGTESREADGDEGDVNVGGERGTSEEVAAGSGDAETRDGPKKRGPVTLEEVKMMVDRVTHGDEEHGRGSGRLVSIFDCSMKNCFGLRMCALRDMGEVTPEPCSGRSSCCKVLYTYLNVPFLQLKQQSLLQQAKLAGERLEREVRELEGFIGGHSYENYMKHLQSTNVDPTAGRSTPAIPPGRPSIPSAPSMHSLDAPEVERSVSRDSGVSKDKERKKKKHSYHGDHRDKDRDRDRSHSSKKKDRHRHKGSSKSGKGGSSRDGKHKGAGRDDFGQHRLEGEDGGEETPEYEGRVDDPKEFAPTTKKSAAAALNDFLGESSDAASDDEEGRNRRSVTKAIKPGALSSALSREEETDSDEMPVPGGSRLKRVTLPLKLHAEPQQPSTEPIGHQVSARVQSSTPAFDARDKENPHALSSSAPVASLGSIAIGSRSTAPSSVPDGGSLAALKDGADALSGRGNRNFSAEDDGEPEKNVDTMENHKSEKVQQDQGKAADKSVEKKTSELQPETGPTPDIELKEEESLNNAGQGTVAAKNTTSTAMLKLTIQRGKEEQKSKVTEVYEEPREHKQRDVSETSQKEQNERSGDKQTSDADRIAGPSIPRDADGGQRDRDEHDDTRRFSAEHGVPEAALSGSDVERGAVKGAAGEHASDASTAQQDDATRESTEVSTMSEMLAEDDKPDSKLGMPTSSDGDGHEYRDNPSATVEDNGGKDTASGSSGSASPATPDEEVPKNGNSVLNSRRDLTRKGSTSQAPPLTGSNGEERPSDDVAEGVKVSKQESRQAKVEGGDETEEGVAESTLAVAEDDEEGPDGDDTKNIDGKDEDADKHHDVDGGDNKEHSSNSPAKNSQSGTERDAPNDNLEDFVPGVHKSGAGDDFFATGGSSDEDVDDGLPNASANLETCVNDNDDEHPQHPPSPRLIASTFSTSWARETVGERTGNEHAGATGGVLSEAAKAAVAAALANAEAGGLGAASESSRRKLEESKARKKKKSHKERRRKEEDEGGDAHRERDEMREKRSSTKGEGSSRKHHHRKPPA